VALAPHVDDPATLLRRGYTFARYRSRPERLFYEAFHRLDQLRKREFARPNPIPAAPLAPVAPSAILELG